MSGMDLEIGQEIELSIERLGINGEGVASWHGYTIFVDGGLPGETACVRLYERRKTFGRGKVVKLLTSSPHRVEPACPLFGKCGGCQLMHLAYDQQLKAKRQRVVDALERIGKIFGVEVLPCEPSPSPLAYRNKIQLPAAPDATLGLYAYNTHDLVPIEKCFIHCAFGEKAFQHIRQTLKAVPLPGLRNVLIKTAVHTGQILVVMVTEGKCPTIDAFSHRLMALMPELRGVVQNINASSSNTILSGDFHLVAGQGYIEERLCGLLFKVSPASFFQVNPAQAEKLYEKALEFLSLQGSEKALDAYCGVGTLSLILAKKAREVVGVECVPEAIADAKENARLNAITNATFTCAQAEEFISSLDNIDAAVLNPPRKGCEASFLEKLSLLKPTRIVYISCDPATLARDLALLISKGYRLEAVQPFDMFPQTAHVETIASLIL